MMRELKKFSNRHAKPSAVNVFKKSKVFISTDSIGASLAIDKWGAIAR